MRNTKKTKSVHEKYAPETDDKVKAEYFIVDNNLWKLQWTKHANERERTLMPFLKTKLSPLESISSSHHVRNRNRNHIFAADIRI